MSLSEQLVSNGYRVAVLCGGNSSERDVSLVSGQSVADAFEEAGVPCDLFELSENALPTTLNPSIHLVLPIVHGTYGEDGTLSAELAAGGFAYAGCDQSSSVLCFDKLACKAVAARMGLPVAMDIILSKGEEACYEDLSEVLGTSIILKPRSHCSRTLNRRATHFPCR